MNINCSGYNHPTFQWIHHNCGPILLFVFSPYSVLVERIPLPIFSNHRGGKQYFPWSGSLRPQRLLLLPPLSKNYAPKIYRLATLLFPALFLLLLRTGLWLGGIVVPYEEGPAGPSMPRGADIIPWCTNSYFHAFSEWICFVLSLSTDMSS